MTIKDLKLGIKKLEELLSVQLKIKEMKHKKDIKSIEVVKNTKNYSTNFSVILEDEDLEKSIRALVLDKLERTETRLIKEIDAI